MSRAARVQAPSVLSLDNALAPLSLQVDFVIEHNLKAVPIEVKSGKDYQIHSALNNILSNHEYGIEKAIVLCNDNVKTDGPISYMPIYMSMFIKNDDMKLPLLRNENLSEM